MKQIVMADLLKLKNHLWSLNWDKRSWVNNILGCKSDIIVNRNGNISLTEKVSLATLRIR